MDGKQSLQKVHFLCLSVAAGVHTLIIWEQLDPALKVEAALGLSVHLSNGCSSAAIACRLVQWQFVY